MTVYELNNDQLNELKEHYFYNDCEESQLYYNCASDIPDFVICEWYSAFTFTEEDFFCTAPEDIKR